jgi:hypothetical protein
MRFRSIRVATIAALLAAFLVADASRPSWGGVTSEEVESSIKRAMKFLKEAQRDDGSWLDADTEARSGTTSLVTLALLTAGEPLNSITISRALGNLRKLTPEELKSTYAVALQAMVFAAAEPERDRLKIAACVAWLERAQLKKGNGDRAGSWSYNEFKGPGDNSNTQYALLGLNAAAEAGVPVNADVWALARRYWEHCQHVDGSWGYTADPQAPATASMTCAGISSLVITGLKRYQGQESLDGEKIIDCGKGGLNPNLQRGANWIARNFWVGQNLGNGQQWRYYYLYGLERAGRLTGQRFFGDHDWYREGAEKLVHEQDPVFDCWTGTAFEQSQVVATSFALLFLAKGRAPVLVNKVRHAPQGDWNNDADDVRNLVSVVSRDWKNLMTWQVVDPNVATVEDMLQSPILFLNGHLAPEFTAEGKKALRDYVEQGGFILAEACCGRPEFDKGFRKLMDEIFPKEDYKELHPLSKEHAVYRSKFELGPEIHPLWGIEHGCRTVVIYSQTDLSCYWNQSEASPSNTAVIKSLRVGQNIVDYATGRELPADKLKVREVRDFRPESPRRGALQIAKLKHAGDWNVAPLAVPNLMVAIRDGLKLDVVINHKDLLPKDPNLVNFPLIYMHGRAALSFTQEELGILRRHIEPGGGTLFADAACGSQAFDAAFRKFVAELLPQTPMVPIPRDDEIYTKKICYDLSDVQYSKAAGGGRDLPQLEGVKVNGHWAVIYSKYDIGCALERHQGLDCKGYSPESAVRIAANIVMYAMLP